MSNRAKSFGNVGGVAASFLSIDTPAEAAPVPAKADKAVRIEKGGEVKAVQAELPNIPTAPVIEHKSRRVQSLLKPSLHEYLTRSAARLGISANDRLNAILAAVKAADPLEK